MKQSTPLILSSTSAKVQAPKIAEARPALKPPTLPKRAMQPPPQTPAPEAPTPTVETPKTTEVPRQPEKVEAPVPVVHMPELKATEPEPKLAAPLRATKEEMASIVGTSAVVAGALASRGRLNRCR